MALEKTKLLIEIEARAKGAIKEIEDTTKAVESLGNAALKTSAKSIFAMQQIEARTNKLAAQIKSSQGMDNVINISQSRLNKTLKSVSAVSKDVTKMAEVVQESTEINKLADMSNDRYSSSLRVSTKAAKNQETAIRKMSGSFTGSISSINAGANAITGVVSVIKILTDPQLLTKVKNLLTIVAAFANIKGMKGFSNALQGASRSVGILDSKLKFLHSESSANFEDLAFKADLWNNKLKIIPFGIKKIGGGMGDLALSGQVAANNINNVTQSLKNVTDPVFLKRMSGLLKILSLVAKFRGFDRLSATLSGTSMQLGRASEAMAKFNETSGGLEKAGKRLDLFNSLWEDYNTVVGVAKDTTVALGVGLVGLGVAGSIKEVRASNQAFKELSLTMKSATSTSTELAKIAGTSTKTFFRILSDDIKSGSLKFGGQISDDILVAYQNAQAGGILGGRLFNSTVKANLSDLRSLHSKFDGFKILEKEASFSFSKMGSSFDHFSDRSKSTLNSIKSFFGDANIFKSMQESFFNFSMSVRSLDVAGTFTDLGAVAKKNFSNASSEVTKMAGVHSEAFKNIGRNVSTVSKQLAVGFAKGFTQPIPKVLAAIKTVATESGSFAKISTNLVTPGLLGIAEKASAAALPMIALGKIMKDSENRFIKFSGAVTIAAGILAGGFGLAVGFALRAVASLAVEIGEKLISAMAEFEKVAQKGEVVIKTFEFAVRGFSRVLGVDAVGSLEEWNKTVKETAKNTNFGGGDIRKSIKLLIADTSGLGITFKQMQKILGVATDLAAQQNEDLVQTTRNVIAAIAGQGVALRNMGLDLTETGLAHSKYGASVADTMDSLDDHAKSQLRFNVLLEKSLPIVGAAKDATDTVKAANDRYKGSIEGVKAALGSQSSFTKAYLLTLAEIANTFTSLPKPIINAVGATQDFLGVSLKIIGTLLKYAFTLSTVVVGYKTLQALVSSHVGTQILLSKVFGFTAAALGLQTGAVTSLSGAYTSLAIIARGAVVSAMASVKAILIGLAVVIRDLTIAIVTNPLFWKALAIASAIIVVGKALIDFTKDVSENISILKEHKDATKKTTKDVGMLTKTFEGMKGILKKVFNSLSALVKLLLAFVLTAFFQLIDVVLRVGKAFAVTDKATKRFELGIENAGKAIEEARGLQLKFAVEVVSAFDDAAIAAEEMQEKLEGIAAASKKLNALKEIFASSLPSGIDASSSKINVFGNSFEKAVETMESTRDAAHRLNNTIIKIPLGHGKELEATFAQIQIQMSKSTDETKELNAILLKIDPKKIEEVAKALKDSQAAARDAFFAMKALGSETFKEFKNIQKGISKEGLARSKEIVELAKVESREKLASFEAQVEGLRKLNKIQNGSRKFSREEAKEIRKTRAAILSQNKALIELAKTKAKETIDKASKKAREDSLKVLKDEFKVLTMIDRINLVIAKRGEDQVKIVEAQLAVDLNRIAMRQKDLDLSIVEEAMLNRKLETLKEITKEQAARKIDEVEPLNIRNLLGGGDLAMFMVDAVKEMAIEIKNLPWAESIQGLKDAIKGISLAGIKKSLADAGKNFVSFFKNLPANMKGIGESLLQSGRGFIDQIKSITLDDVASSLEAGFKAAANFILDMDLSKISTGIKAAFEIGASVVNGLASMFNPSNIQGLVDGLKGAFTEIPQAISSALQDLPEAMRGFVENFGQVFGQLLASLPALISDILAQLPAVVGMVLDAIVMAIQQLPAIFAEIIQKLPDILGQILAALPQIISALLVALPQIINEILAQVPKIFVMLLNSLPAIISEIISGLIGAVAEIAIQFVDVFLLQGGAFKMAMGIVKAIIQLIPAIVNGIANGLKRAFSALFGGVKLAAPKMDVKPLEKQLDKTLNQVSKVASNAAEDIFSVIDLDQTSKAGGKIPEKAKVDQQDFSGMIGATKKSASLWTKFLGGLDKGWKWVEKNIVKPLKKMGKEVWGWVKENIVDPILKAGEEVWGWVKENIVDPILKAGEEVWGWVKENIVDPILKAGEEVWGWVKENIVDPLAVIGSKAFTWVKTNIVDPLAGIGSKAFTWVKTNIVDPLAGIGEKAFKWVEVNIITPFNSLVASIKGIKLDIFDTSKLKERLASIFSSLNPANLMSKLFSVDFKGKGKVERAVNIDIPFANFAKGGDVPGNAAVPGDSLINDKVLALLSPGEKIIPRSALKDVGVSKVVDGIIKSGKLPQFAFGGFIGSAVKKGGDALASGGKKAISSVTEVAKKLDPRQLFEKSKDLIADKAIGFITDMLQANSLNKGGEVRAIKGFAKGGLIDDRIIAAQEGEFVLQKPTVNSLGAGVVSSINQSGKLPGQGTTNNVTVNIEEGAFRLEVSGEDPETVAEMIFEEIKRRSLDGGFIISDEGTRGTA